MNTTITDSGTENKIWKYLLISMISIFCAGTVSPNQSHLPDVAGDSLLLLRIHVASGNTTKCHRLSGMKTSEMVILKMSLRDRP